jgi:hypothetical protein
MQENKYFDQTYESYKITLYSLVNLAIIVGSINIVSMFICDRITIATHFQAVTWTRVVIRLFIILEVHNERTVFWFHVLCLYIDG